MASWSWPGCEGRKNKVRVYATGDYVELFVNDRSYGKKKTKEYKAEFKKVIYEPGKIVARSYTSDGKLIGEKSLSTESGNTRFKITSSKTELSGNGEDMCYVDIDLVGDAGTTKSSVDVPVTIEVDGAADMIAFGSARPAPIESFTGNVHTTYLGKAQAVIRAKEDKGEAKIVLKAAGIPDAELVISVK